MANITQMKRGLSLRPTYDQVLLAYLSGEPNIKKPDRTARFVRESPQYQDLLKMDFIELEKQQSNILKEHKRNIILREQASLSSSDQDFKSVLASEGGDMSGVSEQVQADLNQERERSARIFDISDLMDAQLEQMQVDEEQKSQTAQAMSNSDLSQVMQRQNYTFDSVQSRPPKRDAVDDQMPKAKVKAIAGYVSQKRDADDDRTPKAKARTSLQYFDPQTSAAASSSSLPISQPMAAPPASATSSKSASPPTQPTPSQLGARSKAVSRRTQPSPSQLGARSKSVSPPTQPTPSQLGARSKSVSPPTQPTPSQVGARSKSTNPPRTRSMQEEREQFLRGMTVTALQADLRGLGLRTTGRKDELIQRLLNH